MAQQDNTGNTSTPVTANTPPIDGPAAGSNVQPLPIPGATENLTVIAQEGAQYVVNFDPANADLAVENGDLVFSFESGGSLTLKGFAELADSPDIIMPDGTIVAGEVIVAQLMTAEDAFSLATAAGPGATSGGGHNYSDDLGDVIELLEGVPPLGPTFLQFSVPEAEDFDPGFREPMGGGFDPGTFTAFADGVAGGFEDWQPNQHVGDNTNFPMQVKITFTPETNEVVDQISIGDLPAGVRLFVGPNGGPYTEVTPAPGDSYDVDPSALGTDNIFMLPPADSDVDIPFNVSLLVRDPDTNETMTLSQDVTATIDAVADQPELNGNIEIAGVATGNYGAGEEGDTIGLNVSFDFDDIADGSEIHTVTLEGVPEEWTLVSDAGLGFGPGANQGDGTVDYTVTFTGDSFNGVLEFNPNEWTTGPDGNDMTAEMTMTARAVEEASDGELTTFNNESEVSVTFKVDLSEDIPEVILVSGPSTILEDDLTIPGADIDTDTITVDFFSDGPGDLALTTDGLDALNLTSNGEAISYSVSGDGQVLTATDAGGDVVFTVTIQPNPVVNGSEYTYTYAFELHQPLDHVGGADVTQFIPVQFIATDSDGDTAQGQLDLRVVDDTPVAEEAYNSVDETDDLGNSVSGSISYDFGADGAGEFEGNGVFNASGSVAGGNLTSGGEDITVSYNNGLYTGMTTGGTTVFTLTLNAQGGYSFTQYAPLDHADGSEPNDIITLEFGAQITDFDGDVVNATVAIDVFDDAPVANHDYREMNEATGMIEGNVITGENALNPDAADDVGEDVPGKLTEVTGKNGTLKFEDDGQSDAEGTYVEVEGEYGTLKIYEDGDYTYTLDGPVNNPPASSVEYGLAAGGSAADMQAAWDGASLYAFDFGTSWVNGGGQLDLSLADDTITYTNRGIGVEGGEDYLNVPDQVNHDPQTDETQALAIDLGFEGNGAIVTVSNHFLDEAQGEHGQWHAYDAQGNLVDSGTFSDTEIDYGSSNNVGSFTINASGEYQYVVFSALPYGGTADPSDIDTDSSDFFIRSVEFQARDGLCELEEFTYKLADADSDTDTAQLKICIEDDAPFAPIPVYNMVDETDIVDVASDTITVDFGQDGMGGFALLQDMDASGELDGGALTSNGVPVTVSLNGNVLTGSAGSEEIFTLELTENGQYTFTLKGQLDHADPDADNEIIRLGFKYEAFDADGDTVQGDIFIDVKDDVPVAVDDINNIPDNQTVAMGNVLDNDDSGADIDAELESITFDGNKYDFGGQNNITVDGDYGTLEIAKDGSYTYTYNAGQNSGELSEQFGYTLKDHDDDTDDATLTIRIEDGVPGEAPDYVEIVDETDITDTETGTVDVDGASSYALGSLGGGAGFSSGGSQEGGTLTSNGVPVAIALAGSMITGTANGEDIFRLDLDTQTGDYSFKLLGHLDHADETDPNDIIDLNFTYTATDADGDAVEGNITVHVKDDAPVANPDHNEFDGVVADGNVITGENGGPGAEDDVGADTEGFLTEVGFEGTIKDFAADGLDDAGGRFVTIDGDYGTLKIYEDGDYTYTLTNPPSSTESHVFDIDPSDFVGQPTNITENGITISVGNGNYLNWYVSPQGEGEGLGVNGDKIWPSGESVIITPEEPALLMDITLADVGPNNVNDGVDFIITFNDGTTQHVELDLPSTVPSDFTTTLTLDVADFEGKEAIASVEMKSVSGIGDSGVASLLLQEVVVQSPGEGLCVDKFDYTLSDYDGDLSSSTLSFCVENTGEAPQITVEGNTAQVTAHFFNMEDDAIAFPMLEEREEISDLVSADQIDQMVDTAETLDLNFETDVTITFVKSSIEVAGYDNALGVYTMHDDGNISNVELLHGSISSNVDNPLPDGTEFNYSLQSHPATVGFFIVKDGFDSLKAMGLVDSSGQPTGNGELDFRANGSGGYDLYLVDGQNETLIDIDVFHSTNQVDINADGQTHAIAGLTDSGAQDVAMIGFEDLYGGSSSSDRDFNDVMFEVTVQPVGDVNLVTGALLSDFDIIDTDSTLMTEVKVDISNTQEKDGVDFDFDGTDYSLVGGEILHNGSATGIQASIVQDMSGDIHVLLTGESATEHYESAVSALRFTTGADPMSALGARSVDIEVTDDFGNTSSVSTTYQIQGPAADDNIFIADAAGDNLTGTAGQDMFVGGEGDDTLTGEQGNDLFFAGSGDDTLTGGQGSDHFVFLDGETGTDSITDYNALEGDALNIADLLTDSGYVSGVSDVHDFVQIDGNTGEVTVDTSGSANFGSGDVIAVLDGISSINTVNMILDNSEDEVSVTPIV